MVVMKFGGTSVKDASAMQQAYKAVIRQQSSKIVVLSACSGITDMLVALPQLLITDKQEALDLLESILAHHIKLINNLLDTDSLSTFDICFSKLRDMLEGIAILGEYTDKNFAKVVSFGEMFSTLIFEAYCKKMGSNSSLIDSREYIKTDSNYSSAKCDTQLTKENCSSLTNLFEKYEIIVAQGFIASDACGHTTLLGRGGSDYTAAIYGEALGAEGIQIFTDVNGILSTDPRIVPGAKQLTSLSFQQVRRLSFFGAKVIHPDTLLPAMEANIPVKILNTFDQVNPGTTIFAVDSDTIDIQSIVLKKDCLINHTAEELTETIINRSKILYSAESDGQKIVIFENMPDLRQLLDGEVEETDIIAICGNNVNKSAGLLRIIHSVLAHSKGTDIYTGFSKHAILLTCKKEDSTKLLKLLHKGLFE